MLIARNMHCPCGSRKRYKQCCGKLTDVTAHTQSLLLQALAHQKAGRLCDAEDLYLKVLQLNPREPNALDMLGVISYTEVRYRDALQYGLSAAELTQWQVGQILHNLGLTCGRLLSGEANRRRTELLKTFGEWKQAQSKRTTFNPLVSIVIPSYNHGRYLSGTLKSVFSQSYANLELIIVDDGSEDGSVEVLKHVLKSCPLPSKFVTRSNRGAPATINEGVELSNGEYINILNSDGCFTPNRIQRMAEEIAARELDWGFSKIETFVTDAGSDKESRVAELRASELIRRASYVLGRGSNSIAFVEYNPAISTGNLFFSRAIFRQLGGFHDYRYNHDWDFCLRASRIAEPWFVDEPLYRYRIHASNTISENREAAQKEVNRFLKNNLYEQSATSNANPLSPYAEENRNLVNSILLGMGATLSMPIALIREIARSLSQCDPNGVSLDNSVGRREKKAIIVLGMHRSGTSAISRTLNLAGARLPENLRPPKLGNNDLGFWEPEEVVQLNEWLLRCLGVSWSQPVSNLNVSDDQRTGFVRSATNMLRAEYGDASLIVLKDPRVCLFVDLWRKAIEQAGYSVFFVHMLRPAAEVAESLLARDGMSKDQALTLWLSYGQESEKATRRYPRVFVRYHDLLNDWRVELERISKALRIDLDLETKAQDVDAFLSKDLYRQRAKIKPNYTSLERQCQVQYEQWSDLCRLDTLRTRRILVASIGLTPNGGLFRFAKVARVLAERGHELCFLNLDHVCDPVFHDFSILDIDSALVSQWDAIILPGANFPTRVMPILAQLRSNNFGKRILGILNDQSRRNKYLEAARYFEPQALLLNNRHWHADDLRDFNDIPAKWIIGAVDTALFAPASTQLANRQEVERIGLQGKTLSDVLPLIERFPSIHEWHVFGLLPKSFPVSDEVKHRIVYRGVLTDGQLAKFYNEMDIVIAAEHHAGWCNVAAEAMACGIPVICAPAGTLDFAIDGYNAVIVPEVTEEWLAKAIDKLLASDALRVQLNKNGPLSLAHMDWRQWTEEFLAFCCTPGP